MCRELRFQKAKKFTYIDLHDFSNGRVKLFRVIEVDSDDMRSADILLCIGMLRGHLREGDILPVTIKVSTAN